MVIGNEQQHIQFAFPTTLGAAMPTVSPADFPLTPTTTIVQFVSSTHFDRHCEILGELIAARQETPLAISLPGLRVVATRQLEKIDLPKRIANRLDALGWRTWGDVGVVTPQSLLVMKAIGGNTVVELAVAAIRFSMLAVANTAGDVAGYAPQPINPATPESQPTSPTSIPSARVATEVRDAIVMLSRWAAATADSRSFAEIIAGRGGELPDDIAAAVTRLRESRPAELVVPKPDRIDESRVGHLLAKLDDAGRSIVFDRAPPSERQTLEEIGRRRGITRERVRQIEERSREELLARVNTDEFAEVRWDIDRVRRQLGIGAYNAGRETMSVIRHALPTDVSRWSVDHVNVLLWLSGPYRAGSDGWIRRDSLPSSDELVQFVNAEGRVDRQAAEAFLTTRGLTTTDAIDAWMEQHFPTRLVAGHLLWWDGDIADKLSRVLAVHDEPADVSELLALAAESHSVRGTRQTLMNDARFVRADRERFGLRTWGLDEYAGLAKAIADELRDRGPHGGKLEDIVAVIAGRFSARPASVRAYAAAPMFVIEGERVRLRVPGEELELPDELDGSPDLRRIGHNGLAIRIVVDVDALRGSGLPARPVIAAWAGLVPDGSVAFQSAWGDVRITWPSTSPRPTIGSIRAGLNAIEAREGDVVNLMLDRGQRYWHLTLESPDVPG